MQFSKRSLAAAKMQPPINLGAPHMIMMKMGSPKWTALKHLALQKLKEMVWAV